MLFVIMGIAMVAMVAERMVRWLKGGGNIFYQPCFV